MPNNPNAVKNLTRMGKGRQFGAIGKFTNLKNLFINSLTRVGGEEAVVEWLQGKGKVTINGQEIIVKGKNLLAFLQMISKMLPASVKTEGEITERIINVNYKKESK